MTVPRLVAAATALLAGLAALQATGVVVGGAAAWLTAGVAVLNAVLGAVTHRSVQAQGRRRAVGR